MMPITGFGMMPKDLWGWFEACGRHFLHSLWNTNCGPWGSRQWFDKMRQLMTDFMAGKTCDSKPCHWFPLHPTGEGVWKSHQVHLADGWFLAHCSNWTTPGTLGPLTRLMAKSECAYIVLLFLAWSWKWKWLRLKGTYYWRYTHFSRPWLWEEG